ncbi:hypothetical protein [Flavobacterium sp. 3HN19-14]|uniref:hypothetical protein n=1 Tax=Flavobacterium sp. 3HN19-14 TaxID=3448133 RepID=UPI003EE3FFD2
MSEKAKYSCFPSELLKEWMGSYFPEFLKTGFIIPHQDSKYEVKDAAFPEYFDSKKFNLLHAGNLMKQRSPEGLIKGFSLFLERHPEAMQTAKLLLLGSADFHTKMLEGYKNEPGIYIHNGSIPFDLIYNLQQHTSINVILEAKSEISPFLPAKFPHCVAADKPIFLLSPYYSETKRLLGNDYSFWSEVDDVEKIAAIIGQLYDLWTQSPGKLQLDRPDIKAYLSADFLKNAILNLEN